MCSKLKRQNDALSFYKSQNVLCYSKNLIAFSASSKTFVPAQKPNLLNTNHLLVWHKMFWTGTKCIWFFGLAQNILWPVKGQGISSYLCLVLGLVQIFWANQKLIYILCQSQRFCATPKDDFHSVNLVFVLAQKFLKGH